MRLKIFVYRYSEYLEDGFKVVSARDEQEAIKIGNDTENTAINSVFDRPTVEEIEGAWTDGEPREMQLK